MTQCLNFGLRITLIQWRGPRNGSFDVSVLILDIKRLRFCGLLIWIHDPDLCVSTTETSPVYDFHISLWFYLYCVTLFILLPLCPLLRNPWCFWYGVISGQLRTWVPPSPPDLYVVPDFSLCLWTYLPTHPCVSYSQVILISKGGIPFTPSTPVFSSESRLCLLRKKVTTTVRERSSKDLPSPILPLSLTPTTGLRGIAKDGRHPVWVSKYGSDRGKSGMRTSKGEDRIQDPKTIQRGYTRQKVYIESLPESKEQSGHQGRHLLWGWGCPKDRLTETCLMK